MLKKEHAQNKDTAVTGAGASRRELGKRRKLEAIEAAARRLFAESGFEATTTRAIADAADIGVGTLFVYFPEKLDLLVHIYSKDLAKLTTEALDELPADLPLLEACARIFDAVFEFYDRDATLARTLIKEMMFFPPERQQPLMAVSLVFLTRLAELVKAGQERGELRSDAGPPLVAQHIFGTYYWCLVNWLGGRIGDRRQASLLLRMSLELIVRGLLPQLGAAPNERGGT